MLHFHPGQPSQFVGLIGQQGGQGKVVVVGFLFALDHDGIDAAVGVLVALAGEIGQDGFGRCVDPAA